MYEVKDLSFSYDKKNEALKNVSFTVKDGEWVSILGHNGSGKSTLAKLLVGLLVPSKGSVFYNGTELSDKTVNEITRACVEMAKVRTGALIVIEQESSLVEYERTGIDIDGIVTSQLLINIFEHNTPLHDGAVIVRGNRITAATCYLPLSDNMSIGKELGTRHRAGVGISEATDSMTLIVSEETGKISVAYEGHLESAVDSDRLRERLRQIQNKPSEDHKRRSWKGKAKA